MPHPFFDAYTERPLILDGGLGTCVQQHALTPDDFGGQDGCNEILVQTRPDVIRQIHAAYFEAGCDAVETDTFGATSLVLGEYGLEALAYTLNRDAAALAKGVAREYSGDKPRWVVGSIGPTTKLPSLGHISFVDLKTTYLPQIEGLIDGGADLLLVETCQDLLQTKAALAAIRQVQRQKAVRLPVMAQVTMEQTGTMLVGMDMAAVVAAMAPFELDVLGMNCATGPQEMARHIQHLSAHSPFLVSCLPNAGIPENIGGQAHYHLSPQELAEHLARFVGEWGVRVVGGCCGTTPDHMRALVARVSGIRPAARSPKTPSALTSLYAMTPMRMEPAPLLVGERTNANGSKAFRDCLQQDDFDGLVAIGKEQVRVGAHVLDVCAAYVGRDEAQDMGEIVTRFNAQLDLPLMIDSTESPVIEAALQRLAGKAIVNSINLEDGEERLKRVVGYCREYGAAVVALTIDEDGMAKTVEKKRAVARRIYDLAVTQCGMAPEDLVFDPLTFTLGSGDEEFRTAGQATIEAIRRIKADLPGVSTILGVSNISFGLKPAARHVLNSVFLHQAVDAGLDMAIINSRHLIPLHRISPQERTLCERLIADDRVFADDGSVASDPLMELMRFYEQNVGTSAAAQTQALPEAVEDRLKYRIVNGDKTGIEPDLDAAMTRYAPLAIINEILLDGMKTVGELFGSGQMQLPFVLQSAETMKAAVAYLEPHMARTGGEQTAKGLMVLATVKGDVHDIGKNLVDIILTNNGYKVVNLGIKQPIEAILDAAAAHPTDAIGMSGLLVKSTAIMKENLELMRARGLTIPVVLGGAALTPRFVEDDCQRVYDGRVFYAKDAFDGLHAMQAILSGDTRAPQAAALAQNGASSGETDDDTPYQAVGETRDAFGLSPDDPGFAVRCAEIADDNPIPAPPFWGVRIVDDIALDAVYPFINRQALFAGQWQLRRGARAREAYQRELQQTAVPVLEALQQQALAEGLLTPNVVYGYFPCQSEGNDLIVYDPQAYPERLHERQRFSFPRGGVKRLCLSDFFASRQSGRVDVVAFQLVTVGHQASAHAQRLFERGQFQDYLYCHGFGVECAEALAEYWHQRIRAEWGIGAHDAADIQRLFAQGYQGARYSPGYPACPHLDDQARFFDLLDPARIGVGLSEEFMIEPEQSTSALIVHHPQARYFDVRVQTPAVSL